MSMKPEKNSVHINLYGLRAEGVLPESNFFPLVVPLSPTPPHPRKMTMIFSIVEFPPENMTNDYIANFPGENLLFLRIFSWPFFPFMLDFPLVIRLKEDSYMVEFAPTPSSHHCEVQN